MKRLVSILFFVFLALPCTCFCDGKCAKQWKCETWRETRGANPNCRCKQICQSEIKETERCTPSDIHYQEKGPGWIITSEGDVGWHHSNCYCARQR